MRLDFKKILLITHLERNCAEESVTREHVMHHAFSQVEGFLVEWSFLIDGVGWVFHCGAVKCELINYSYQYVQKKCVTLDTQHLKHFIFQNI